MDMYKEAVKAQLRFATEQGNLTTEQLFGLTLKQIDPIVRALKSEISKESDDELSFLNDTATQVDKTLELKFNIAKDIYLTKKSELEAITNEAQNKQHNQKIYAEIKRRQDLAITEMTDDELLSQLK